jgi:hypothetical protein
MMPAPQEDIPLYLLSHDAPADHPSPPAGEGCFIVQLATPHSRTSSAMLLESTGIIVMLDIQPASSASPESSIQS